MLANVDGVSAVKPESESNKTVESVGPEVSMEQLQLEER